MQQFRPLKAIIAVNPDKENEEAYRILIMAELDLTAIEKELLTYITDFYNNFDGIPSREYIGEHFLKIARTSIVEYLELLDATPTIPFLDYKAKVTALQDEKKDNSFKEALKETQIIFQTGKVVGKQTLKGRKDALEYFQQNLGEFADQTHSRQVGTLRQDASVAWQNYLRRKNDPLAAYGITSGFYNIDQIIKGGKPGELHFVLGYTSSGKSLFSLNYAYNAACILGRNVVMFSLEMTKDQVMAMLYTIHSAHEKFQGVHPAISVDSFMYGMTPEEENFMSNFVIPDLESNPEHGEIMIEYPGEALTISSLKAKLSAIQKDMEIEMLIVDYPELMVPDKGQKYSDYGTSLNTIIKSIKQLALTYNNGKGLFALCPYQANRDGFDRATKNFGVYDLRAMSYANEAERACDVIYSVYKEQDSSNPNMIISNLKNRRGPLFESFKMSVLWPSGYMNVDIPQEDVDLDSFDWEI